MLSQPINGLSGKDTLQKNRKVDKEKENYLVFYINKKM
jgi:hypothetical protein